MSLLAFGVDDSVEGAPLANAAAHASDPLGHPVDPLRANARVIFASFHVPENETYSDYDRVLSRTNTAPFMLPGEGKSYPDTSGLGTDLGLARNVSTIAVGFDEPVRAVRVFPAHPVRILAASLAGAAKVAPLAEIGIAAADEDGASASLRFPLQHENCRLLLVECTGPLALRHLAFFADPRDRKYAVFPMLPNHKPLPYTKGRFGTLRVTRLGGVHTGLATLWTCEVLTDEGRNCLMGPCGISGRDQPPRQHPVVDVNCLSIEDAYLQETIVYEAILHACNTAFQSLARVERASVRQLANARNLARLVGTQPAVTAAPQAAAQSLPPPPPPTLPPAETARNECRVDCRVVGDALYINDAPAPGQVHLVRGITYTFSIPIAVGGVTTS
eukprot:6171877-Pleurochrysis_carterae.AAC.1